jgi:hypothetical protein
MINILTPAELLRVLLFSCDVNTMKYHNGATEYLLAKRDIKYVIL